jgi:EAL domain-containing protein (putative c-di-GMP-specific phosphodiesterase class I)
MSVNVAAQQFLDAAFAEHVRVALDATGLPPRRSSSRSSRAACCAT